MNLAIYGAGSLGTILGAYITQKGYDIDLISRNESHIAGLKEKGAIIRGTVNMIVPVKAITPSEMTKKYDIVFLLTKSTDNINTVKSLIPHLAPEGVICTMQNGLPEIAIAELVGPNRTYGCAIAWGATLIGNGVCELTSEPDSISFSLGSFNPNTSQEKIATIKSILESMGKVEVEKNFIGARWSKLLINSAFSGMSTVLGCTFGEAAKNRASRLCIQRIIKECIDVADKAEIKIEPVQGKDITKLFDYNSKLKKIISYHLLPLAIKKHKLLKASMLQDIEKGKKTEVDEINGAVCRYGFKYNFPTPYNDMVVKVMHEIEAGTAKPGFHNLERFSNL